MSSEFDCKRLMHGTIKISPSGMRLTRYARSKKCSSTSQAGQRRRNRSCFKTANNVISLKPKSLQNQSSAERLLLERSASQLRLAQGKQNTALRTDAKAVSKSLSLAAKNAKINNSQLVEILKKLNFDFHKKPKKRGKAQERGAEGAAPRPPLDSKTVSLTPGQPLNLKQTHPGRSEAPPVSCSQPRGPPAEGPTEKMQPPAGPSPTKQSYMAKQNQLKELLKQIYKKNEELLKSKGAAGKEAQEGRPQQHEQRENSSKKKLKRYSEEKWVDAPQQQAASSQEPAPKQSQRFSEGSGMNSQKSYNNFTFFEKQTSLKDSK